MFSKLCVRIVPSVSNLKPKFNFVFSLGRKFMTLFTFHDTLQTLSFPILAYDREMKVQFIVYISLGKPGFLVDQVVANLPDKARRTERLYVYDNSSSLRKRNFPSINLKMCTKLNFYNPHC